MAKTIHPTAIVDPAAELADGVSIGPNAIIGPGVVLGEGCEVGSGAQVQGPTILGRENRIFPQAAVGFEPQDLKFAGEQTRLEIGDRNQFREFSTMHRGTGKGGGLTTIGSDNLFMVYSHVAHDCSVGSRTVFANSATLAGHVEVEDDVTISAFSAVHQFCRVGCHAYIGGYSVITKDALPYVKTVGQKPRCYGVNSIGLERKGVSKEEVAAIRAAMRLLMDSGLNTTQALERLEGEMAGTPHVDHLISFLKSSQRGVIKARPGRGRGARGGRSEE
ncbi:MAG: acyl-ACP--UDP-N-acetylglucosamine O-acyltransferase [Deltaproteobacteria bacterium]|nr:acyl-ACP--UDP-N-acetylglucosamine O-acyltransferase [Deltaproteobacteria bacterium]